eukprot:GHRR01032823.1.p1 GENE.GHRR01032823.1~~GHRR01032823.1.p1  ORF type:complete len:107 (+),score=29.65 GHRR01032823.1:461-781(+)
MVAASFPLCHVVFHLLLSIWQELACKAVACAAINRCGNNKAEYYDVGMLHAGEKALLAQQPCQLHPAAGGGYRHVYCKLTDKAVSLSVQRLQLWTEAHVQQCCYTL